MAETTNAQGPVGPDKGTYPPSDELQEQVRATLASLKERAGDAFSIDRLSNPAEEAALKAGMEDDGGPVDRHRRPRP